MEQISTIVIGGLNTDFMTSDMMDETGYGDQTMAMMTASLQQGKSLEESANLAILAGTLQFHKSGIEPITIFEIGKY